MYYNVISAMNRSHLCENGKKFDKLLQKRRCEASRYIWRMETGDMCRIWYVVDISGRIHILAVVSFVGCEINPGPLFGMMASISNFTTVLKNTKIDHNLHTPFTYSNYKINCRETCLI